MHADDSVAQVLAAAGIDVEVLEQWDYVPLRARAQGNVLKLRTAVGTRACKRVAAPATRLRYVHLLTEHVHQRGWGNAPRMIWTRYGDPFVVHPTGCSYMTNWIRGRSANLRHAHDVLAVTTALAGWHRAAANFSPLDATSPDPPDWLTQVIALTQEVTALYHRVATDARGPFAQLLGACGGEIVERAESAIELMRAANLQTLEREARANGWVCQTHVRADNFLFDGEHWTVINYDHAGPGHPMYDLAALFHRYLPAHRWDEELLVAAYRAYQTVHPQASADPAVLALLLSVPWRCLQIVHAYAMGHPVEEEDYVDALEDAVELEEQRYNARLALLAQKQTHRATASSGREFAAEPASAILASELEQSTAGDFEHSGIPVEVIGADVSPMAQTGDHARSPGQQRPPSRRVKRRVRAAGMAVESDLPLRPTLLQTGRRTRDSGAPARGHTAPPVPRDLL